MSISAQTKDDYANTGNNVIQKLQLIRTAAYLYYRGRGGVKKRSTNIVV